MRIKYLDIELTNRCNLSCPPCWFHGCRGIGDRYAPGQGELSTAEVVDLVDQVAPHGPRIYFGGGEPFLRGDLFPILAHVKRKGLAVSLTTNGTLLDVAAARRIVELGVEDINVSVDGDEPQNDAVRGEGTFRRSTAAVRGLLSCRREARRLRPRVAVNLTVSPGLAGRLLPALRAIREAVGAVDLIRVHHQWFITEKDLRAHHSAVQKHLGCRAPGACAHLLSPELIVDGAALAREIALARKEPGVVCFPDLKGPQIERYYRGTPGGRKRCLASLQAAVVKPDGEVRFCPDEWIDDYVLGHVRCGRFDEIWNNERARRFRAVVRRQRCFPACRRCSWMHSF